jgi:type VI secretion system ImpM family protein
MLGSLKHNSLWRWTAVGKHPAAADYIKVANGSALLDAVADWMAKGYDDLLRTDGRPHTSYSWRFWLRGIGKGMLICGLGRDSSDSLGRPFPFLVMGEGPYKHWEKQWTWLTAGLEKTWARMEYIAAHGYDDVDALTSDLATLTAPEDSKLREAASLAHAGANLQSDNMSDSIATLQRTGRVFIGLTSSPGQDALQTAMAVHDRLIVHCVEIPRAVFLGGTPQRSYLGVIQHPLTSDDFLALWRV